MREVHLMCMAVLNNKSPEIHPRTNRETQHGIQEFHAVKAACLGPIYAYDFGRLEFRVPKCAIFDGQIAEVAIFELAVQKPAAQKTRLIELNI